MVIAYPIVTLIDDRMKDLGLTENELLTRAGYMNLNKGRKRLNEIRDGDFRQVAQMNREFAAALDVDPLQIDDAVAASWKVVKDQFVAEYRRTFRPHAIFIGERSIPSQITIFGMVNGNRYRVLVFDDDLKPEDYAAIALERLPEVVPWFGRTTGFVVNYAPDKAIYFDVNGNLVGMKTEAHKIAGGRWLV